MRGFWKTTKNENERHQAEPQASSSAASAREPQTHNDGAVSSAVTFATDTHFTKRQNHDTTVSASVPVSTAAVLHDGDPTEEPPAPLPPRLVHRTLAFHQSHNHLEVEHNQGYKIGYLVRHDFFHILLRFPTVFSLTILLTIWTAAILFFAALYGAVDRRDPQVSCGLGEIGNPISFPAAFAFSLETCTTVGYGLPSGTNAFFENCAGLQVVIYFQMVWSMLFNAFLFAFFYSRLARCDTRAVQVVFSKLAIVSHVNGQVRLQIRVCDVDGRHPVVEAHVRLYVITKRRPVPRPLRVIQPDDELGGMLFLSMPTVVSHTIDLYSILHPPSTTPVPSSGLTLRQVDSTTASREEVDCPICSESYPTHERWVRHVRYQQMVERKDNYPVEGSHLSISQDELLRDRYSPITDVDRLRDYFGQEISEIICVVEGIDPLMSGTFQALQSYRCQDIVFQSAAVFHPCLRVDGKHIRVDLDRFHLIDTMPTEAVPAAPVRPPSIRTHDSFFDAEDGPRKGSDGGRSKSNTNTAMTCCPQPATNEEGASLSVMKMGDGNFEKETDEENTVNPTVNTDSGGTRG